jgi:hypothetical protein
MRAYNCLRRSGLMTVGQVLEKSEEELLALRNFGRKSYDELRERLDEMNLLPMDAGRTAEDEGADLSPALPLEDDERPIGRRSAVADDEATSVEPRPVGRKTRAKAASSDSETEGEEEIPDWKRALKQLTEEQS